MSRFFPLLPWATALATSKSHRQQRLGSETGILTGFKGTSGFKRSHLRVREMGDLDFNVEMKFNAGLELGRLS